jgi:Tfp pilus assembly protein PilF
MHFSTAALLILVLACAKPEYTGEQYMLRGVQMVEQKNLRQARLDFDKAIELDSKLMAAYMHRGALNFGEALANGERDSFIAAIEDFSQAIELENYNPNAYYFRGDAFRSVGQVDDARADWQAACSMRNNSACARLKRPIKAPK